MNIQDTIKSAQNENKSDDDGIYSFQVEAWTTEEKPFIIYHRAFTLSDVSYIAKNSGGDKATELVYTVVRKALDAEGKKLFTIKDINFLTKGVKSNVIVGIVNKMNAPERDIDYSQE